MEVRCRKCNKMLYRLTPDQHSFEDEATRAVGVKYFAKIHGAIECKCPRCGELNVEKENVNE